MLIGAPEKYLCANCQKKFVSRLRKPIRLPRMMGAEKYGCECVKIGEMMIHTCHGRKNPEAFPGSEWACSALCYTALTGKESPITRSAP